MNVFHTITYEIRILKFDISIFRVTELLLKQLRSSVIMQCRPIELPTVNPSDLTATCFPRVEFSSSISLQADG